MMVERKAFMAFITSCLLCSVHCQQWKIFIGPNMVPTVASQPPHQKWETRPAPTLSHHSSGPAVAWSEGGNPGNLTLAILWWEVKHIILKIVQTEYRAELVLVTILWYKLYVVILGTVPCPGPPMLTWWKILPAMRCSVGGQLDCNKNGNMISHEGSFMPQFLHSINTAQAFCSSPAWSSSTCWRGEGNDAPQIHMFFFSKNLHFYSSNWAALYTRALLTGGIGRPLV